MPDTTTTPAARGLKAALARNARLKAEKGAQNASAAPATPQPAKAAEKPAGKAWVPPRNSAEKASFASANARIQAVLSHPACAAHRNLAAKLLQNPKLSAREIGNLLDFVSSTTASEQNAALAEMQAVLAEQKALNSGASALIGQSASGAGVWAKAYEKLGIAAELVR